MRAGTIYTVKTELEIAIEFAALASELVEKERKHAHTLSRNIPQFGTPIRNFTGKTDEEYAVFFKSVKALHDLKVKKSTALLSRLTAKLEAADEAVTSIYERNHVVSDACDVDTDVIVEQAICSADTVTLITVGVVKVTAVDSIIGSAGTDTVAVQAMSLLHSHLLSLLSYKLAVQATGTDTVAVQATQKKARKRAVKRVVFALNKKSACYPRVKRSKDTMRVMMFDKTENVFVSLPKFKKTVTIKRVLVAVKTVKKETVKQPATVTRALHDLEKRELGNTITALEITIDHMKNGARERTAKIEKLQAMYNELSAQFDVRIEKWCKTGDPGFLNA